MCRVVSAVLPHPRTHCSLCCCRPHPAACHCRASCSTPRQAQLVRPGPGPPLHLTFGLQPHLGFGFQTLNPAGRWPASAARPCPALPWPPHTALAQSPHARKCGRTGDRPAPLHCQRVNAHPGRLTGLCCRWRQRRWRRWWGWWRGPLAAHAADGACHGQDVEQGAARPRGGGAGGGAGRPGPSHANSCKCPRPLTTHDNELQAACDSSAAWRRQWAGAGRYAPASQRSACGIVWWATAQGRRMESSMRCLGHPCVM